MSCTSWFVASNDELVQPHRGSDWDIRTEEQLPRNVPLVASVGNPHRPARGDGLANVAAGCQPEGGAAQAVRSLHTQCPTPTGIFITHLFKVLLTPFACGPSDLLFCRIRVWECPLRTDWLASDCCAVSHRGFTYKPSHCTSWPVVPRWATFSPHSHRTRSVSNAPGPLSLSHICNVFFI